LLIQVVGTCHHFNVFHLVMFYSDDSITFIHSFVCLFIVLIFPSIQFSYCEHKDIEIVNKLIHIENFNRNKYQVKKILSYSIFVDTY
jgi:hypothetical protein